MSAFLLFKYISIGVYNSIRDNIFPFAREKDTYVLFVGSILLDLAGKYGFR